MNKQSTSARFICILCPLGCELKVSHDERRILEVRGNRCARGAEYAEAEVFHPVRIVTTTVRITGGHGGLLPVKSAGGVPRDVTTDVVRVLSRVVLRAPVGMGDVVMHDACGTGVDIVATRSIASEE